jgi:hypothetical protein
MNQANKAARDRTAVYVVCATKLLLFLSSKRYHKKKKTAWKWEWHLTPYGEALQDKAFENNNYQHYSINNTEQEIMFVVMARQAMARPRAEFQGPLILC